MQDTPDMQDTPGMQGLATGLIPSRHGHRKGDTGGTYPSTFQRFGQTAPFSCNLIALLESPEDTKIASKIHVFTCTTI